MSDDEHPDPTEPAGVRLAREIRRRRTAASLSQPQLAQKIGYTRQYVSLAERADHNLPSMEIVKAIDRALDAEGALVALREESKSEQERLRRESTPQITAKQSRVSPRTGTDQEVLSPPLPMDVDPWVLADALTRSGINGIALDHMERAAYGYAQQYPVIPPGVLWPSVSGQITRLNDVLAHPQPQRVRRRVAVLLGVLTGVAGHLLLDLNRHDDACRYFDVAGLAAREAESPDLAAWVLAVHSLGPFFKGDHRAAVELLVRADREGTASSPRRRAWISALLARATAALGDTQASLKALDDAHHHTQAISDPPTGTDFFDAARLDGMAGTTHLLLRRTEHAAPLLRSALERRATTDVKGRALLALDLAECHLHDNEPDEAARVAISALDWADKTMVDPILTRAEAIRAHMVRSAGSASAQSLDARLQEATRD
ncbi:transcriptional regulator with XRE-family HTH domain [Saccharothrix longispora]|uniref:Transcriptional regulator with XRE-family HTH domain n=2 Tax=Saccharothrix longispora TaxID=33920 RepID=A0ABU1PPA0_9PSEU|nr:helix-turn-helix transcriptional regulator [Saccharothrix longispora]MDR6592493.1 transcriptional regulator with XRE-family HTH domain [Saccharothrix longispora]